MFRLRISGNSTSTWTLYHPVSDITIEVEFWETSNGLPSYVQTKVFSAPGRSIKVASSMAPEPFSLQVTVMSSTRLTRTRSAE